MTDKPTYEELEKRIKTLEKFQVEHMQLQDKLQELEGQLNLLTEQSLMAVIIIQDDKIIYANHAYAALTGYPLEEILQWTSADTVKLIHPDYRDFVLNQSRKKMLNEKNGVIKNYQYKGAHENGDIRWVDQYSQSVLYNGKPANMISMIDIHDRKLAEERLKESEERYRAIFDRSADCVFINDFDGNYIDANPATHQLLGYDENEISNVNMGTFLSEDQLPGALNAMEEVMKTGSMKEPLEHRLKKKDGTFVDVEIRGALIHKDGKPYAIQGIARDVTERKKAEKALKESEERYSALFDRSNDCVYINDLGGNFLDANAAALELLGYSKEEIHSLNFASLLSEEQLARAQETMKDVIKTGSMKKIGEYQLKRKDGTYVDTEIKTSVIYRDGKPYAVQGIARDVTERKKAEEALKKSEERFRDLYENAPIAYFSARIEGTSVIRFNKAAMEITGYNRDESLKLSIFDLYSDKEEDRAKAVELYKRLRRGESIRDEEVRIKKKNGDYAWVSYSVEPVRDETGNVIEGRSMAIDITERKRLQENLQDAKKMEAIVTLAGGLAHQFNNALSVMTGNIDLLRLGLIQEEGIGDCASQMMKSVEKMSRLTQQLVSYAKGGKYQPEVISIKDVLMDTLPLLQHTMSSYIEIDTRFPQKDLYILVDRTQIQMVLKEIFSNASEAIEKQGTIGVSVKKQILTEDSLNQNGGLEAGPYVHLTITDDGRE